MIFRINECSTLPVLQLKRARAGGAAISRRQRPRPKTEIATFTEQFIQNRLWSVPNFLQFR
jgi:hypothetical protein